MFEAIILSLIQGFTEFLPISSSAHLILVSEYLNFEQENLILDISLHIGSLLAVIIFFRKEIINFIKNKSLFYKILTGSLPTIIFGFVLVTFNIIDQLRNETIIAYCTIVFGIILYLSDRSAAKKNIYHDFSYKNAIFIGTFQVLSLIPGVSRSGITISAARFLNFSRIESAKISFLLSIPTLIAVSSYGLIKIAGTKDIQVTTLNFFTIFLSFLFSFITLKLFIKFLKRYSLVFFTIYRIILGIFLIKFYV